MKEHDPRITRAIVPLSVVCSKGNCDKGATATCSAAATMEGPSSPGNGAAHRNRPRTIAATYHAAGRHEADTSSEPCTPQRGTARGLKPSDDAISGRSSGIAETLFALGSFGACSRRRSAFIRLPPPLPGDHRERPRIRKPLRNRTAGNS